MELSSFLLLIRCEKERQKVSESGGTNSFLTFFGFIFISVGVPKKITFRCAFSEINVVMLEIKSLVFTYFLVVLCGSHFFNNVNIYILFCLKMNSRTEWQIIICQRNMQKTYNEARTRKRRSSHCVHDGKMDMPFFLPHSHTHSLTKRLSCT
jgi:hypothetical protein